MKKINKEFKNGGRYISIGPVLWIASIQFFIVQIIVAKLWHIGYSIRSNTISDLGNTVCGQYSGRYICSSDHTLMNISFIVLGLTMILGSLLMRHFFNKTKGTLLGLWLIAISGAGTILVGLFPENTVSSMHIIGAGLSFAVGGIALLVLGFYLNIPKSMRVYSIVSGVVSLVALALFLAHIYLGIGIGGMERLAGHPITIWLIVMGIYGLHASSQSRA